MQYQTTICDAITVQGIGLHSGLPSQLIIQPAATNSGILFVITQGANSQKISASWQNVQGTLMATTLKYNQHAIQTIEHLLSSFNGLEIDNLEVHLDSDEVPIMEGSAKVFTEAILKVGKLKQNAPRQYLRIKKNIRVGDQDRWISIEPAHRLEIDCSIDFPYDAIGKQSYRYQQSPYCFWQEIASARTFGFMDQIETLKSQGLIKGGSVENAIVISNNKILNSEGLRFKDEFVRHKILDILGDIYLAGAPILGKIKAHKSGHQLHHQLLSAIFSDEKNYERVSGIVLAQQENISRSANKFWYSN